MIFDRLVHKWLGLPYKLAVRHDARVSGSPTIVFLHGIGGSSKTWLPLIKQLGDSHDFKHSRLIALDLLGFGHSPAPSWSSYTLRDQTRAIRRTLRRLKVSGPLYFVGHSMGALVAVQYATDYKTAAGLVLVSPPLFNHRDSRAYKETIRTAFLTALGAASHRRIGHAAAKFAEKFSNFEAKYAGTRAFQRSLDNEILSGAAWKSARNLRIPTVVIAGKLDPMISHTNLRKLTHDNKHITLVEHPGGHPVVKSRYALITRELQELA